MAEPARAAVASDIDPAPTPAAPAPPLEATARALLAGCALGVVLAAGNVYTSLKVGIIDGGGITAALVAFGVFAAFRRAGRTPYSALECNLTQTAASSAAVMSFVTGVVGPIPALALMGTRFSGTAVVLFGAAVGMLGIFVGALLRRRLVEEEALPFPTGIVTGEVVETIFGAHQIARRRIMMLTTAAAAAAAITWFRDARPSLIPQGFMFGGTLGGIAAGALGLGVSCSPLMLATGAMVGLRGSVGMLLGAVAARVDPLTLAVPGRHRHEHRVRVVQPVAGVAVARPARRRQLPAPAPRRRRGRAGVPPTGVLPAAPRRRRGGGGW